MMKVRPCSYREAADFVNEVHRHLGAPPGGKFAIKVVDEETGEVHGVAMCGRPVGRRLDDGMTLEINRVATDGASFACSMLYGACCRVAKNMGYRRVVTYTLAHEPGKSLKAAGFVCEGEAGGTHWTGERDRGQELPREMKVRWVKVWE